MASMGQDTEERIKAITAEAAAKATREELDKIFNEKFLPVLVQRQRANDSLLKVVIDTMKHFISQVEIRLLAKTREARQNNSDV